MEFCGLGRNVFVLISFTSKEQHGGNKFIHKSQVEISNDVAQILKTKPSYIRRYIQMNYNSHFQSVATEYEASVQAASAKIATSDRKLL
jgi:hypothetical protein